MFKQTPARGRRITFGGIGQQVKRSISLPNFGDNPKRQSNPRRAAPRSTAPRNTTARSRASAAQRFMALDRYSAGFVAALAIGLVVRLPNLFSEPVDAPAAPQATYAAFVRGLAQNGGSIKAAIPWVGPLPTDPTAGLPLFAWLAALPAGLIGAEPWIGRVLSVAATLLATFFLFLIMRRLVSGRAALYAALFMGVAPLALYFGRAYLPEAFGWAAATGAVLAVLNWQSSGSGGVDRRMVLAAASAALAVLIDPVNLALLPLLLYLVQPWYRNTPIAAQRYDYSPAAAHTAERRRISTAWIYLVAALLPLAIWWLLTRVAEFGVTLEAGYGAGGIGDSARQWFSLPFYGLLLGNLVNSAFTVTGFLLLLAGLPRRARTPWPWALHIWALGGLLAVLFSAGRLALDDSALAVLAPAAAALAGTGASWLAGLPAQIAAANAGRESNDPNEPEAPPPAPSEGPVRGAVRMRSTNPISLVPGSKSPASWESTRDNLLLVGNLIASLLLIAMIYLGLGPLRARFDPDPAAESARAAGAAAAATDAAAGGAGRVVVVGSGAAEIFYGSKLSGWALAHDDFKSEKLEPLIAQGATMLVTMDQDWLNSQDSYISLRNTFGVATFQKSFIAFDLLHKPPPTDSDYFAATGHSLRGSFRVYWETRGGLATFGLPLTEEVKEVSPDDGVERTVQYFERAVLELHPENAGTAYDVLPAPLGRWIVERKAKELADRGLTMNGLAKVPEFTSSADNRYFPETGHSVRGEFLKAWDQRGGVNVFGYPITEERREVNPVDGKVYIEQYFERARFEWHDEIADWNNKVQFGLLGSEWLATK